MNFAKWLRFDEALALKGNYKGSIFQRLVAAIYNLAPTSDPRAEAAYADLKQKIGRQDQFLASKWQFNPGQADPYPSMKAMTRDIHAQQAAGVKKPVIPVYAEPPQLDGQKGGGHPYFSNDDNVTQRGVHDIIAHYAGQHPFSARGEYGAYNRHLKTLCNPAQVKAGQCLAAKAMFTEVVAQTSYYYIYGGFSDQKMILMDDFDYANVGLLAPTSPLNAFFMVEGKTMAIRPDFSWDRFATEHSDLAMELLRQEEKNKKLEPIFHQLARS